MQTRVVRQVQSIPTFTNDSKISQLSFLLVHHNDISILGYLEIL